MEAKNKRKLVANILKVTQSGEIILNIKTIERKFSAWKRKVKK